jgi:hypothetical protein
MVSDQRHGLDAMIISIAQVLRSIRAGIIEQLDDELVLPVAYNQGPLMEVDAGEKSDAAM